MAQLSKQALKVGNNTSFPNNNTNYITPTILRDFNVDMIDSMVDEIPYGAYTQSVNTSLSNINAFTASASGLTTGSLLITASAAGNVITFTKGNNTTFNVTVATGSIPDISNLNQATASLQQYTASANVKFSNLETTTASLNTSVSNINTFTASTAISLTNLNQSSASQQISIDSLNSKTGSYATTGSNTFVGSNTFTSISASSFVSASAFIGNGGQLTGITASIAIPVASNGVPQGNATTLDFYGNAVGVQVIGGTALININAIGTGSFNAYTASTNAFTASAQVSINNLNLFTASFSTASLVSTSSFNSYTSSNNQRVSSLEVNSASVNTSISALNTYTASQSTASLVTSITNLNTFSASALVSISNLNTTTASLNSSVTQLNASSASQQVSIDNLNAATSSYIKSSQTSSMSVATASIALAVSTSISTQNLQHFVTFVDNSTGTQAIYVDGGIKYNPNQDLLLVNNITSSGYISASSLNLTGTLTASLANGYVLVGNGSNITTLVATSSFGGGSTIPVGTVSSSAQILNYGIFATTGSNTFRGSQVLSGSLFQSSSNSITTPDGNTVGTYINNRVEIYGGNGTTGPTPRLIIGATDGRKQTLGGTFQTIDATATTGLGASYAAYSDTGSAANLNLAVFDANNGNGDTEINIIVDITGTQFKDWDNNIGDYSNWLTLSPNDGVTIPNPTFTRGLSIAQNLNVTGSLTASLQQGYTWVGNSSGRTTTVATSSFGTPIPTGTISGSAQITALGFVSSSVTASSLITASVTNNTITFTKGDSSTFNITVNTGSAGGAAFPYAGTASISGSLQVTGSMSGLPITLSVTSNTASIDMTAGNQFVLTLPSSSTTHIAPSSIKAGQTINLLIKQQVGPATGSIAFAPSIYFPSGLKMQATATGSAIDLISMISFDTTNLMAANVKNLK